MRRAWRPRPDCTGNLFIDNEALYLMSYGGQFRPGADVRQPRRPSVTPTSSHTPPPQPSARVTAENSLTDTGVPGWPLTDVGLALLALSVIVTPVGRQTRSQFRSRSTRRLRLDQSTFTTTSRGAEVRKVHPPVTVGERGLQPSDRGLLPPAREIDEATRQLRIARLARDRHAGRSCRCRCRIGRTRRCGELLPRRAWRVDPTHDRRDCDLRPRPSGQQAVSRTGPTPAWTRTRSAEPRHLLRR